MVIQCEACSTKFRIDDSKVTDKGVKVRCSKCKHVFTVRSEAAAEPSPFEESLNAAAREIPSPAEPPPPPPEPPVSFDDFQMPQSDDAPAVQAFQSAPLPDDPSTPDFQAAVPAPEESDFGTLDFGEVTALAPPVRQEPQEAIPDFSDGFQLDENDPFSPSPAAQSGEKLFDDVAPQVKDEQEPAISFDFAMDDEPAGQDKTFPAVPVHDEPLSLGDINFGEDLTAVAVQHVNPDDLKQAGELFFASPAADTAAPQEVKPSDAPAPTLDAMPAAEIPRDDSELPPLSISSRKKDNPVMRILVAILAVVAVAAAGFFGYTQLSGTGGTPEAQAPVEKISLRAISSSYVNNSAAGTLFVIRGEAVNEFKKPRASVQVKGVIFGANGQPVATKSVYCGNALTNEQLATMPMDKIEAAMANQFGDSLGNLEVLPGKSIPFVIVTVNPPADAREFGIEVAGSTVAAGK